MLIDAAYVVALAAGALLLVASVHGALAGGRRLARWLKRGGRGRDDARPRAPAATAVRRRASGG